MLKLNAKLLAILLSVLLVADLHASESIEVKSTKIIKHKTIHTICVKGYLYLMVENRQGISITQMFINGPFQNSPAKTIKCKSN